MKRVLLLLLLVSFNIIKAQDDFGKVKLKKVVESKQKTTDQSIFHSEIQPISGTEFRLIKTKTDKLGMKHRTYQQYYNGIKVHFGILKIHERNGLRETFGGAYFNPEEVKTNPSIPILSVKNIAQTYMRSNDVFWIGENDISKTVIPEPELLILPNRRKKTMHLAYAIGIGVSKPELKMGIVYVDAQSGEVLKFKDQVYNCFDSSDENHSHTNHDHKLGDDLTAPFVSGTGATAYSGSQTIETTLDTDYILYDQTRANTGQGHNHGAGTRNGIVTVNFNNHDNLNDYNSAFVTDFTDNNNNWTAGEMSSNEDQYALDAHWGSQVVYEYWKNMHGRDSYDGNDASIVSYVHFDNNYTNAGWVAFNSQRGFMIYGDGGGSFTPLTNLDVVGHEIGHGVTNANSDLDYELESGALNEGMSDIWAAAIDMYATANHSTTKSPWLINDENGGGSLRSMSNPNAYGQPDTYGGTYWYDVVGCTPDGTNNDYCGVHTNSGVLNYWFYLLVNGGSGTNDIGSAFSVSGLGIDKSAAIAYRMESIYLTSTSDYASARDAAIQATQDLYGYCSSEEESVTNAFYAVGVGAAYSSQTPSVTTDTTNQTVCTGETATFYAEADYANTMVWQNDASGSWTDLSDDTTYSGTTTNTLTVTNPPLALDGVRFRLEFSNDCGSSSTTNNRYLYVDGIPSVTSVTPMGAGCTGSIDGSLIVTFDDVADMSNLEFSIDGGVSYPHNFDDTTGTQTISGLTAGDYDVWVRRGNDGCPRQLGTYTITSVPTVTANVDAVIEADIAEVDGIIQVSFNDEPTQTNVKFSIDGGVSYAFVFDDSLGTGELTGLAADTYDVWVAFGDESCAKSLGSFTLNEIAYTQIPDANFENALNNLTYDNYLGDNKVPTSLINTITSLNVRVENIADLTGIENFTALEILYADNNNLTSVDVSNNAALRDLRLYNNYNLTSFNVANPAMIEFLSLSDCSLSGTLDLSNYTTLTVLSVQGNDLTGLNMKNGNNVNVTYFHAGGNSSLNCIIVDDAAYSTTNWTNNGGATFSSAFCDYTAIPDVNFENALEALGYDDISSDGQVPRALIEVVISLDVNTQSIADFTGIEDFTALIDLNVQGNALTSLDVSNNLNLQTLNFDTNNVAILNLGANTNLTEVSGRYNQLTSVDVSANIALDNLNLRNNTFTTVDVSNNTNLTVLNLNQTGITSLDITNNTSLSHVYLLDNSLTSLDISQNPLIENINLTNNNLTTIDLSNQTVLRILRLSENNLSELNLNTNVALTQVECADNDLISFNFKNEFNQIITDFDASGNANLSCILIDDLNKDYTFWTIDVTASFTDGFCRYTAIPDSNFEAALEVLGYDDISADGQVPTALIEVITDLNVDSEGISDITGIEDFTALTSLSCFNNALTTIDLSYNLNLENLMLKENALSTINVLNNKELVSLRISDNSLTTLDVSNNVNLSTLRCDTNNLTTLDVSNNTQLVNLDVYNMATLTSLNIDFNTNLQSFKANNTGITALDFSNNPLLRLAYLHQTSVANVDFSQNPLIEELKLQNTQITALDVSLQTALTNLNCSQNSLLYLNVKNGNNGAISEFDASGNPNLVCILVDDTVNNDYSTWTKDVTTNFSETYCRYTAIPDANFEAELEAQGYDDITADGQVPTALIEVITSLGVSQKSIADLTGIEDFTALTNLNCSSNILTALNVTSNTALESLNFSKNSIASIDVSNNVALEQIFAFENSLTTIDVSQNTDLVDLDIDTNFLTSLDISANTVLETLDVINNSLVEIDVSNNLQLWAVYLSYNTIANIDFSNHTLLEDLECVDCELTYLNVQNGNNTNVTTFRVNNNPDLTCILVDDAAYSSGNAIWIDNVDSGVTFNDGAYCRYTAIPDTNFETELRALGYDDSASNDGQVPSYLIEGLETLNVENKGISDLTGIEDFRALKSLDVGYNSLSIIDVTNNTELRQLIIRSNNLTTIDLSANTLLVGFKAENCSLTSLDITNNPDLKVLWLTSNDLTAIDLSNNVALTSFWGSGNDFVTLDLTNNPGLNSFRASSNSLTALNLQNGANTNIAGGTNFQLTGNAELACVLVDDAAYSATNWLIIDGLVSFSDTDCDYTLIPDANFEARLETLGYDDISGDGKVPTRFIEVVTSLNVSNQDIADLTGIEDFTALEYLVGANNSSLTTIDVSNNTNLLTLSVFNCGLTSLDVTNNTSLQRLVLYGNAIASLDVSLNTELVDLDLLANDLTTLDVTNNVLLQTLFVEDNNISSLDLSNNIVLMALTCRNNNNLSYLNVKNGNNANVTNFTADNNPSLSCIVVDDVAYSTTYWDQIDTGVIFNGIDCRYTAIPDANFEAILETLGYDDIPADGQVPTALIEVVTSLDVRNEGITDVTGIEDFTALQTFNCNLNSIAILDVSNNVNLTALQCTANPITSLNLANNTQLTELNCRSTDITSLDVTNNILLKNIICFDTDIVSIDVSQNLLLEQFHCYNTNLTSLNLSLNTALRQLRVENSELVNLNIKNGNNTNVTSFNASGNPNLSCIEVDDLANDYTGWAKDAMATFTDSYCRYTTIPDATFEARLNTLGYDDMSNDGQVPTSLIETVTYLYVPSSGVSDLTGIEDFLNLERLICSGNNLTTIDLSSNMQLQDVDLSNNNINSIAISNSMGLEELNLRGNALSAIDVSNNIALLDLDLSGSDITNLDITNNTLLTNLNLDNNDMTTLDVSSNVNLKVLEISSLNIATIDLSNNTLLEELIFSYTALTGMDLTNNVALAYVECEESNQLIGIDLSNSPVLDEVYLSDNALLSSLSIKNGNNVSISTFEATGCPNLTCILVDDATYSVTNWSDINGTASFNDVSCDIYLSPKTVLQGAALNPNTGEETLMRDDLRVAGIVPTSTPYTDGAMCSSSVFAVTGNDAIVDWVWVELRDKNDNTSILHSTSALLQRDGDVVDVDGISALSFSTLVDNYFVAIKHRNHLGIMTSNVVALSRSVTTVDFTDANNQITYGTDAQTTFGMPSGVVAMWSGDTNGDGRLNYSGALSDVPFIRSQVFNDPNNSVFGGPPVASYPSQGYEGTDANLDGVTVYSGASSDVLFIRNNIFNNPSNSVFGGPPTSTYVFVQQLPEGAN